MPKIELPPTKSSLRKLKEDLAFAYEGHDLLNQKREILAMEIVRKIGMIRKIEADFQEVLNKLYAAYKTRRWIWVPRPSLCRVARKREVIFSIWIMPNSWD